MAAVSPVVVEHCADCAVHTGKIDAEFTAVLTNNAIVDEQIASR
jgi:hypothetical protein